MSSDLLRSRKARADTDYVCEWLFGPLAHIVVLTLAPLHVPPPLVVCANGSAGVAGAVELARGHLVWAARSCRRRLCSTTRTGSSRGSRAA